MKSIFFFQKKKIDTDKNKIYTYSYILIDEGDYGTNKIKR